LANVATAYFALLPVVAIVVDIYSH